MDGLTDVVHHGGGESPDKCQWMKKLGLEIQKTEVCQALIPYETASVVLRNGSVNLSLFLHKLKPNI